MSRIAIGSDHAGFELKTHLVALLRERGRIVEEIYDGNVIRVTAMVTPKLAGQIRKLLSAGAVQTERMA